jgi:hypothetical protein
MSAPGSNGAPPQPSLREATAGAGTGSAAPPPAHLPAAVEDASE